MADKVHKKTLCEADAGDEQSTELSVRSKNKVVKKESMTEPLAGALSNSKSADIEFYIVSSLFEVIVLLCYSVSSDYANGVTAEDPNAIEEFGTQPFYFYSMFQDVHAMMFIGFGFLMTFLRRYGYSALSFNFLICAFCIPWGIFLVHQISYLFGKQPGILEVNAYKLVDGDIATAVVLISFGAILGRTNPAQLVFISFFELIFWAINFYICVEVLGIIDVGGSIVVHAFGAYFGLAVSWVLKPASNENENKSVYHSDLFSMIGTLFLWLYWPSFNGYFANRDYYFMDRTFVNTVFSLTGSTVATFMLSKFVNNGKFDMVHIQNATLAGGVAVGAAADLYLHPSGALSVGLVAGILSTMGYKYMSDMLQSKLNIADTCGVNNLHGMPGILGGIVSAIALAATPGNGVYAEKGEDGYPFGDYTPSQQAGYQVLGVLVTLSISIVSGLCVGFIVKKLMTSPTDNPFVDDENFLMPDKIAKPSKAKLQKKEYHSTINSDYRTFLSE